MIPRIKKLDVLIIRSFLGPFVVTFFVVLFAFVMQTFWLYMDELLGKGLGALLMIQLLMNWAATLIPMALPLGILLAAIMTFGNLGENYELVAIKSSGISLFRFMRPLTIFIIFIAAAAFLFNNYVIPVANLKTFSLLYDMRNQKPTMNIREGIFNKDIDGFAIRVGKKDKDGQTIKDVIIYDHTQSRGNENVVLAKDGKMYPSPDGRYLIFELHDGWRYEENNDKGDNTQTRMHFAKWYKVFDLSKFAFSRTKEELFKGNEVMMNVGQLSYHIDSNQLKVNTVGEEFNRLLSPYYSMYKWKNGNDSLFQNKLLDAKPNVTFGDRFVEVVPAEKQEGILSLVESNIRSIKGSLLPQVTDTRIRVDKITRLKIEWHKKFTLSFACILLFLIGAPLGAIIRKGGIGMPVVVAIAFFVIYFIINSTGEKLAKQGTVAPWYGMWLATAVLLPIALIIMTQARNDSNIFNKELYTRIFNKIKGALLRNRNSGSLPAEK
jgi:lipopolysaccharide export system permease protein